MEKKKKERVVSRRRSKPRYFCIVIWQKGGLIPWYWGGILKWGPATQAVFFMDEAAAGSEMRKIRESPCSECERPGVVDVAKFNKKHGLSIAPQAELLRF